MRWLRTGWSQSGLHRRWEYNHANKRKFYTDQAMENLSPFQIQDRAHQNFYFYHPTQQPKKLRRMQLPRIPADINNDSSSDDNDDNPIKQLQYSLASGKFSLKQIQSSTPTPKARPKFSINPKAKATPSTTSTTSTWRAQQIHKFQISSFNVQIPTQDTRSWNAQPLTLTTTEP